VNRPRVRASPEGATGKLLELEPARALVERLRAMKSGHDLRRGPVRISRAPGRLDVMGGIADYTGSLVCEATLNRAAAVAVQAREDRIVRVVSLNLADEEQKYAYEISLDALAGIPINALREQINGSGGRWAGYMAGCVAILQQHRLFDFKNPATMGFNLVLLSTVPLGGGVSSSAAIEVAAMLNVMDHYKIRRDDPMVVASMCQEVENDVVGAPCGIMDQVTSCLGDTSCLLRMICQPHELQPPLQLPEGIRVVGINSAVKHSVGGGMYGKTRCAAFLGHRIILEKMREMGRAAGAELLSDPMRGYLANLDPEDYKKFFRPYLPAQMSGKDFLDKYISTVDTATRVEPGENYHVLQATDHHVLEAMRVRNFVKHLETAGGMAADSPLRKLPLDKAGHLMYASHVSYTNDALLGAEECDILVDAVRRREHAGLYGAKITGGGSGGTVAVLADISPSADEAIGEILAEYEERTGHTPEAFTGTSPGAWGVGTGEILI
jgi:galactokinase